MNEHAWQALLTTLGRAGPDYTSVHRAVTALFVTRKCGPDSESLADRTLDRVAQKIHKGEYVQSIVAYSKKVADLVWKEYCREQERFRNAVREFARQRDLQVIEENSILRRKCQEECINKLPKSELHLIREYYIKAKERDALAAELGMVIATLRTNIHRLKGRLLKCVEDCWRSG